MQRTIGRREGCNVHSRQWQLGKYSKVWQSERGSPLWIPTFPILLAFIHPKLQTGALVAILFRFIISSNHTYSSMSFQ